ncbi:MAG: HD domain-containing protein [Spirochaetota bacterium]|jgi:HD-GYP domain-containing protein (c-di-GMP phosphodiesterase class II)|nr:HD domain-containing protein [Spirochaetota bacterium]
MADENPTAMRKLRTADLKDGMRFTNTVFIDKRNILVGPNAPVKQKDIERLLKWGINELETEGELIPDEPASAHSESDDDKHAGFDINAELDKLHPQGAADAKSDPKKQQALPKSPTYVKRNINIARSLKGFYQSWLDDLEQLHTLAANDFALDKEESTRIAQEIIEKVHSDKNELVGLMRKGKKKNYAGVHGVNVAVYAAMVGGSLEMPPKDMLNFVLGCLYIDIGMVKMPLHIFSKETKLNPAELREIHSHPIYGYQILVQKNNFPSIIGLVAMEHHERMNAQGYPRKLNGPQISSFGRIAAIIDTFEAMTSQRSYREEYISHEAMRTVVALSQGNFDKQYLTTFLREIGVYPVGTFVRLNNNAIALVVAADPTSPMRPELKILFDEFGDPINHTEMIWLAQTSDLEITKALNEKERQVLL